MEAAIGPEDVEVSVTLTPEEEVIVLNLTHYTSILDTRINAFLEKKAEILLLTHRNTKLSENIKQLETTRDRQIEDVKNKADKNFNHAFNLGDATDLQADIAMAKSPVENEKIPLSKKNKTILSHMNEFVIPDTHFGLYGLPEVKVKITTYNGGFKKQYVDDFNKLIDKFKTHGESVLSFFEKQMPILKNESTGISPDEITKLERKIANLKTNLSKLDSMKMQVVPGGKRRSRKSYRKSYRKSKKPKSKSRKH